MFIKVSKSSSGLQCPSYLSIMDISRVVNQAENDFDKGIQKLHIEYTMQHQIWNDIVCGGNHLLFSLRVQAAHLPTEFAKNYFLIYLL